MWARNTVFIGLILAGLSAVGASLLREDRLAEHIRRLQVPAASEIQAVVEQVDSEFQREWHDDGLQTARRASDRTIMRRLSLGLAGKVPSLEELRMMDAVPDTDRLALWTEYLLADRRSSDYIAERLARSLVATDRGPFLVFRRRRFVIWLSDQLAMNVPYDQLQRKIVTGKGLWTDSPSVNFFTATITADKGNQPDPVVVTGRLCRALLAVRMDCLQCHDDVLGQVTLGTAEQPREGTQRDFHRLAAYFSDVDNSLLGIQDKDQEYRYQFLGEEDQEVVLPAVPFLESLANGKGNRRQQLARWMTHRQNRPFARAAVNRTWALLFGRPLVDPIDDIPLHGPFPAGMEILASDFIEHGFDLRRLVRVISSLKVYQLDSRADFEVTEQHELAWAVFPLTRLRPEQVAGSISQATSLSTLNAEVHFIRKVTSFEDQSGFLQRFGDKGKDEFQPRAGTVAQRLLMMNGMMVKLRTNHSPLLNGPTRIAQLVENESQAVEAAYLCVLSRLPSQTERDHFEQRLAEHPRNEYSAVMEDMFWTLINSTEFSWNH